MFVYSVLNIRERWVLKGSLLSYASTMQDIDLTYRLNKSETLHYHAICRSNYRLKYQRSTSQESTAWHDIRQLHKDAFNALSYRRNSS